MIGKLASVTALALMLGSCTGGDASRITEEDSQPFGEIGEDETIQFAGTEPFWGGEVTGNTLSYTTPENLAGTVIEVRRFAGMNGLGYSGELDGMSFDLAITPGDCSDRMSDRIYPYTATLRLGDETRNGCAFTQAQPFTKTEIP